MKKRLPLYAVILIAVSAALVAALITAQLCYSLIFVRARAEKNALAAGLSEKIEQLDPENDHTLTGKFRKIYEYYQKYYVGELSEEEFEKQILKHLVADTGDVYAEYYTADEYKELTSDRAGESVGIGVYVAEADGGIAVTYVEEGSPAKEAGILRFDRIVEVNGEKVEEIGYDRATALMRGKSGEKVSLMVSRSGETKTFEVARATVRYTTVRYEMQKENVGYIRILSFGTNTPDEFKTAVDTLTAAGAKALVFDLRSNGGGSLSSIFKVLDYLVADGEEDEKNVLLFTKDALENVQYYRCGDEHSSELPSAVLTNGGTASAAELFAACLRDYGKAVLVGSVTYGKGVAQSTVTLDDGSAFKLTTHTFNPPVSDNFDGKGLAPDVEAATEINFNLLDFEEDACCLAALEALKSRIG